MIIDTMKSEILIIGGGVIGTSIARELSKYDVDVILIEKEAYVSAGATKGSYGIVHPGFERQPGTLKAKLTVAGHALFKQVASELDVLYKEVGEVIIAIDERGIKEIEKFKEWGEQNKSTYLDIIGKEELRRLEPNVTDDGLMALYSPSCGIVFAPELTMALADNAIQNGVKIYLNTECKSIRVSSSNFFVDTNNGTFQCKYIINAAGIFADKIAAMIGQNDFSIILEKREGIVLDKNISGIVKGIVMVRVSNGASKIVLPTIHGNVLITGTFEKVTDRYDTSTSVKAKEIILKYAKELVSSVSEKDIITQFAVLLLSNSKIPGDHLIENSKFARGFINVVVGAPGVAPAFAIAKMVVNDLLPEQGLTLVNKPDWNPYRRKVIRFNGLPDETKKLIINGDERYGHVICRCETVTEGEIIDAITRGARCLDEIKFRTRAGMGRCQGGFCGSRVPLILARELGVSVSEISKKGRNSRVLLYRNKELL